MINPLLTSIPTISANSALPGLLSSAVAQPTVNTPVKEFGFQGLGSMLLVVLLLVLSGIVTLWLIRRRVGISGSGPLRVVQTLYLGPRERVVLIEHGAITHLVGVTSTTISMLASSDGDARPSPGSNELADPL